MMTRDQGQPISYEQWRELTAKDIFFYYEEDKPKDFSKLYDLFGDEFEEDEHPRSESQKVKIYY